ncbi:MAG TPA: cytochrome c biogenesis heme-transporting ATPase CcmA [Burkholderiaceae bacterium]|nr:cytochrome c biogenesis heme-transporting ATPase CcmA [Burkholderiaceae bacterium]HQR70505.1 cytochrome c biogenesis heme-transporting ATPase CcmA [Burkholderiaceae bacterium]
MIEAVDLTCERGERLLFSGLSFSAENGTLLRIAGPNGTGKTSLLRIMCALLEPTAGEIRWKGGNVRRLREEYWKDLAYIGHLNGVKDDLTVRENLRVSVRMAGRYASEQRLAQALDLVGLAGFEDKMARFLSQGQRRRVALARLYVSESVPLWILDEPFTALDVRGVAHLSALIARHVEGGGTVVLTTHQEVPVDAARRKRVDLGSPAAAPVAEAEDVAC